MTTIVLVAGVLSKPVPGAAAAGYKLFSRTGIYRTDTGTVSVSEHEFPYTDTDTDTVTRNTDPFKPRTDESLALFHPYSACTVSATVVFIHITLSAPNRMGRTSRSVQIRRDHSSLCPRGSVCLLCDCGSCTNYRRRRRRRRRKRWWWWSLLVKIEGDPLNSQHAHDLPARKLVFRGDQINSRTPRVKTRYYSNLIS